jgi:hypothetical protein
MTAPLEVVEKFSAMIGRMDDDPAYADTDICREALDTIAALQQRCDEAEQALQRFGMHYSNCRMFPCNCGLDAARSPVRHGGCVAKMQEGK